MRNRAIKSNCASIFRQVPSLVYRQVPSTYCLWLCIPDRVTPYAWHFIPLSIYIIPLTVTINLQSKRIPIISSWSHILGCITKCVLPGSASPQVMIISGELDTKPSLEMMVNSHQIFSEIKSAKQKPPLACCLLSTISDFRRTFYYTRHWTCQEQENGSVTLVYCHHFSILSFRRKMVQVFVLLVLYKQDCQHILRMVEGTMLSFFSV